jgi:hypothetical protein
VSTHHRRKATELDAREIEVHFSPELAEAFKDLAAAVHFSEHFDPEIRMNLQDLVKNGGGSLRSVLTSLPTFAEETFKHIAATGDERAREAWSNLATQIWERDRFTLTTKTRARSK